MFVPFPTRSTVKLSGFTLVELLTVIAVIAVIAGLAFPAYTNLQKGGRNVETLANLRALQAANQVWANDHNRVYLPPLYTVTNSDDPDQPDTVRWFENEEFKAYLTEQDIMRTGQTVDEPEYTIGMNVTKSTNDVNDHLDPEWEMHEMQILDNKHKLMAFAESADHFVHYDNRLDWENDSDLPVELAIARRYNRKTPVVFYDGHVDMLDAEDLENEEVWFYDAAEDEDDPEEEEEEGDGGQTT